MLSEPPCPSYEPERPIIVEPQWVQNNLASAGAPAGQRCIGNNVVAPHRPHVVSTACRAPQFEQNAPDGTDCPHAAQ